MPKWGLFNTAVKMVFFLPPREIVRMAGMAVGDSIVLSSKNEISLSFLVTEDSQNETL